MFGRHKKNYRRRPNIVFVTFRLILSLLIFAVLMGGVYSAYKQFSGVDPVKVSPKALINNIASPEKIIETLFGLLSMDFKKSDKNVILGSETTPESKTEDSGKMRMTDQSEKSKPKPRPAVAFKFALIADSHNENELLSKALNKAKEEEVGLIIGLGDYTEVGTFSELQNAKAKFDEIGIRYFVTAGDHDLWDSRNKNIAPTANFVAVFGPTYQSFGFGNARFIILDNSDNYLGLGEGQLKWLAEELDRIKKEADTRVIFTMLHEPLYHPSATRVMGKVTPKLLDEAKKVTNKLRQAGVKEVFAGDVHFFTKYSDSDGLSMTTIGAVASQRNTQDSRFGLVTVYEDGSYSVEDIEIK